LTKFYTANGNFAKVLITKHLHKNKSSNYNRLKYNPKIRNSLYQFVYKKRRNETSLSCLLTN